MFIENTSKKVKVTINGYEGQKGKGEENLRTPSPANVIFIFHMKSEINELDDVVEFKLKQKN